MNVGARRPLVRSGMSARQGLMKSTTAAVSDEFPTRVNKRVQIERHIHCFLLLSSLRYYYPRYKT